MSYLIMHISNKKYIPASKNKLHMKDNNSPRDTLTLFTMHMSY